MRIPVDSISHISFTEAKAGKFLFAPDSAEHPTLYMVAETEGQKFLLSAESTSTGVNIRVGKPSYGSKYFITYDKCRLLVDPNSQVHGTRCSPALGTLLLTAEGPGILYEEEQGYQAVFLLDGGFVQPNWGRDTGYYDWSIEYVDEDRDVWELFKVSAPPAK